MDRKLRQAVKKEIAAKQFNDFETDFKVTVLGASLVENGYDRDKISIVRQGASRRGFADEIEDIQLGTPDDDERLLIKVNKEGIYDLLPQNIFHGSVNTRFNKGKEEVIKEIRQNRDEEFFARKFFQIFEMELDTSLIEAQLYELHFDKRVSQPVFLNLFRSFWPVIGLLSREQGLLFLHFIPHLHVIRQDKDKIAKALSAILEIPVRVDLDKIKKKSEVTTSLASLGECRLEHDAVLDGDFDDGLYDMRITFGPLGNKQMEYFCKHPDGEEIISNLCTLYFPADMTILKEFIPDPGENEFILSATIPSYLGINTCI